MPPLLAAGVPHNRPPESRYKPDGSLPASVNAGPGKPCAVTMKFTDWPVRTVADLGDVNDGVSFTVSLRGAAWTTPTELARTRQQSKRRRSLR